MTDNTKFLKLSLKEIQLLFKIYFQLPLSARISEFTWQLHSTFFWNSGAFCKKSSFDFLCLWLSQLWMRLEVSIMISVLKFMGPNQRLGCQRLELSYTGGHCRAWNKGVPWLGELDGWHIEKWMGDLRGCLPGAVGWQWQGSRVELSVSVQWEASAQCWGNYL